MTPRRLYNFRIDAELDAGLKAVKARDGISESEQVRRALLAWLKKKGVIDSLPRTTASARQKAGRKRAKTRKHP